MIIGDIEKRDKYNVDDEKYDKDNAIDDEKWEEEKIWIEIRIEFLARFGLPPPDPPFKTTVHSPAAKNPRAGGTHPSPSKIAIARNLVLVFFSNLILGCLEYFAISWNLVFGISLNPIGNFFQTW